MEYSSVEKSDAISLVIGNHRNTLCYSGNYNNTNNAENVAYLYNCTPSLTAVTITTGWQDAVNPLPTWLIVSLGLLATCTSIVTISGNLIVLLSFILERSIRQPTNYFIASLAMSDLLIGAVSMPLYTVYLLKGEHWTLGEVLCDLWLSVDYTLCLCSIYTVFCITIDRFCSVKLPAKYREWRTEHRVLCVVCFTWIVPALVFFPSIFGWQNWVGQRTVPSGKCWVQYMDDALFNCLLQIGYFWVTLFVMCSLYAAIYRVALNLQMKSEKKQTNTTTLVSLTGQRFAQIGVGMSDVKNATLTATSIGSKDDYTNVVPTKRLDGINERKGAPEVGERGEGRVRHVSAPNSCSSPEFTSDADSAASETPSRQTSDKRRLTHHAGYATDAEVPRTSRVTTSRKKMTSSFRQAGGVQTSPPPPSRVRVSSQFSFKKTAPRLRAERNEKLLSSNQNDKLKSEQKEELLLERNKQLQKCSYDRTNDRAADRSEVEFMSAHLSVRRTSSSGQVHDNERPSIYDETCNKMTSQRRKMPQHPPRLMNCYVSCRKFGDNARTTTTVKDTQFSDRGRHILNEHLEESRGVKINNTSTENMRLFSAHDAKTNYSAVENSSNALMRLDSELGAAEPLVGHSNLATNCNLSKNAIAYVNSRSRSKEDDPCCRRSVDSSNAPSPRAIISPIVLDPRDHLENIELRKIRKRISSKTSTDTAPSVDDYDDEKSPRIDTTVTSLLVSLDPKRTRSVRGGVTPRPTNAGRQMSENQKSRSASRARKALRTITIILGAFVFCWTPWHVFSLIIGFCNTSDRDCVPPTLYNFSYYLCYLNSPLNPFCYALANQQFKKVFARILRLDWHRT